ncbi:MAG: DUF2141 domain-containing protein [Croceibacterium sp.]
MKRVALLMALPVLVGAVAGSPRELGKKDGACRPGETGPALLVTARGLKDHTGNLKLEIYPPTDPDFLSDDATLVNAGKTFRRVEVPVPAGSEPELCIRVPAAGTYALMLLHDRNKDHKFHWTGDGIGFGSNPTLGFGQPKAAVSRVTAGPGLTRVSVTLTYLRGLRMRPLRE